MIGLLDNTWISIAAGVLGRYYDFIGLVAKVETTLQVNLVEGQLELQMEDLQATEGSK